MGPRLCLPFKEISVVLCIILSDQLYTIKSVTIRNYKIRRYKENLNGNLPLLKDKETPHLKTKIITKLSTVSSL